MNNNNKTSKFNNEEFINLTNFFFEVGSLRKTVRSHRQRLLTSDVSDNISSHSFRVSIIGYFLALMEGADAHKVALMCMFHDIGETRSGDLNWVHKNYVKVYENEIIEDQIKKLPNSEHLYNLISEYNERTTNESKIAKDADIIEQMFLLREHSWDGNKEAQRWFDSEIEQRQVFCDAARNVLKALTTVTPGEWGYKISTSKRR